MSVIELVIVEGILNFFGELSSQPGLYKVKIEETFCISEN